MSLWLIDPDTFEVLSGARERTVNAQDVTAFEARVKSSGGAPKNYSVEGDVARISVSGPLTKAPDFWAWLLGLGGTTYGDIQAALAMADQDARAKSIELFVDSPGGQVDGLFETIGAIRAAKKPIKVRSNLAASAAYALAAAAGPIEAVSPAAMFGSIGVVASFQTRSDVVDITSTEAPNKRPDVRTDEGRAVIREQLDAIHELFVDAIAKGRGVSAKTVNSNFGRGGMFLAADAKERGMVDAVVDLPKARPRSQLAADIGGAAQQETIMDLKTIKAQHPDLAEALRAEGVASERERVTAHLILAEASGDTATAIEAIKAGGPVDQLVQAKHFAAAIKKRDITTRQGESDAAASALDGAKPTTPSGDVTDRFAASFKAALAEV